MFTRWLIARRDAAAERWAHASIWCEPHTASARRRLRFWDLLVDAVTLNGRR